MIDTEWTDVPVCPHCGAKYEEWYIGNDLERFFVAGKPVEVDPESIGLPRVKAMWKGPPLVVTKVDTERGIITFTSAPKRRTRRPR